MLGAILPPLTTMAQTDTKPKPARPKIGSTVFKWDDLAVKPTPNGERRDVANNPTATLEVFECHITTLNPGRESHAPHRITSSGWSPPRRPSPPPR